MARRIKQPVTAEDIRGWERGWADMMITIWRENLLNLKIFDTGRLYDNMSNKITDAQGQITISHEFMTYGIYVARGVGNGYSRGNGGDLDILNSSVRDYHGLNRKRRAGTKDNPHMTSGKPRKRRDWFYPRYASSIAVLSQVERDLYGEMYMGTLSNVIQAIVDGDSAVQTEGGTIMRTISRF